MAWHEGAGEMAQTRQQHLAAETYRGNKRGLSGGSDSKESVCNEGDRGLIPGWGSSRGEGNGNPL